MKRFYHITILVSFSLTSFFAASQKDTVWKKPPSIELNLFLDAYYVYDFNQPKTNYRQPFLYNHNRHNEFNLNLGLIKLGINHEKYRANLGLQVGTYVNDNYASESNSLKLIHEASVGISMSKKNKLWIDMGILSSHIGFESALSSKNPTLTRSLLAENSPYFETGAKITYTPSKKIEIAGLVLNGWQNIQRISGNSIPSFGTQLTYKPSQKTLLNWSTFIGTTTPDSIRKMRYFNNLYGQFQLGESFFLTTGFDIGYQQQFKNSNLYDFWMTPIAILQYAPLKQFKTALRIEYYQDKNGVMIPTSTPNGFATTGVSLNFDYTPVPLISCRIEGRWLNSKDQIFVTKTGTSYNNFIIAGSIAFNYGLILHRN